MTLFFDVFGTVFDWRTTIRQEGSYLFGENAIDWDKFAEGWAAHYSRRVSLLKRCGQWEELHKIMRQGFYELIDDAEFADLQLTSPRVQKRMSTAWERLRAWPDAYEGFGLLANKHRLIALSNADEVMLYKLMTSSDLPCKFQVVMDGIKLYKPDPRIYTWAMKDFDVKPSEAMMVAAHCFDLNAAHAAGMKTALITRPTEPGSSPDDLDHVATYITDDLAELAERILEC